MWVKLSRRELRTLFYDGRKLMLVACLVPMGEPKQRTVKALKSFGYQMLTQEGKVSELRYEPGTLIWGGNNGISFIEVKITDATGNETHAHYRLLVDDEEFPKPAPKDFYVRNEGSVFLLNANTPAAYTWCEEHLPEDAPRFGLAYVVEPRYINEICRGFQAEGLTLQ